LRGAVAIVVVVPAGSEGEQRHGDEAEGQDPFGHEVPPVGRGRRDLADRGLLPDEPPFLEGVLRLNRLVQATWLALPEEGPQLRDSAGFSPDFAARRRAAH
jgi:hypothetical protein